jgi:3-dehydroquinate dehydratase II
MSGSVLVINGPNLNMLGVREPETYGSQTLADVERTCIEHGRSLGLAVDCIQSNHEGEIVDAIHRARGERDAIIINGGAYSHTSIAIRDALVATALPAYEVHITNIYAREHFRHHSRLSGVCVGVICGLGVRGYLFALDAIRSAVSG